MTRRFRVGALVIAVSAATIFLAAGCGQEASSNSAEARDPSAAIDASPASIDADSAPAEATTVAPSTTTTTTRPAEPLAGRTIALDPGHNEHNFQHTQEINQRVDVITIRKECDTTGTSTNDGYTEAEFTSDVAARTKVLLEQLGAKVVLTRDATTPWGPCITERAAVGNRAKADVAISIHADGGPGTGRGFHVIQPGLVAGSNDAIIGPSAAFARVLHDTYLATTGMPVADYIAQGGYDTRSDLGGLNLSTVPKVFIECGNMRNATDAGLLKDPAFRQLAAQAIASSMEAYLTGRQSP